MISHNFTTTFTVKRMVYTQNKGTKQALGSFKGHIQQTSLEIAQQLRNLFTITHSVWCAIDTDVQVGDELTKGANTYSVKAVQDNNIGINSHKYLHCEKNV
jgi:hypothetical protein